MKKLIFILIPFLILVFNTCNNKGISPNNSTNNNLVEFEGVLQDSFNNVKMVFFANSNKGTMVAFNRKLSDGTLIDFTRSSLAFPDIFISTDSTIWNIFGEAVSGPKKGEKLERVNNQIGYWFSFATFFPRVTLTGEANQERVYEDFSDRDWLINPDKVITGAIKDGIPALSSPNFIQITNSNCNDTYYVNNSELVTVIKDENNIKVYPHKILDWHEIVNDEINGKPYSLSYCPLTGTSDAWERTINGKVTTFGVSGFLYNDNLILYDRETDSLWPQILKVSANGELINTKPTQVQVTEMTWAAAKTISCDIQLLSDNTGFTRNYAQYPYGTYKDVEGLLFPISFEDKRVFGKERVLNVLVDNKAKAYRFSDF
jgi:uncharacterized protein DUF3179